MTDEAQTPQAQPAEQTTEQTQETQNTQPDNLLEQTQAQTDNLQPNTGRFDTSRKLLLKI